jgi:C4-dicarboxylate-specific signal transduction histidine kinase
MINLINNSTDAVIENTGERMIHISITSWQQNRVRIKVMNNGPDIPPDIQEKIFVPFFTTKTFGSGVGLSICQEIIKLHGGSLTLLSSAKATTTFMAEF